MNTHKEKGIIYKIKYSTDKCSHIRKQNPHFMEDTKSNLNIIMVKKKNREI